MPPLFTGVGVALVTLFHDDGALNAPATADLSVRLVDLGVRAVLVAGTTGEPSTMAPEERSALISAVRAASPGDVPVIAGTGAATGPQAAELT
ncbi:MAG: putative Dihydrodipicolinate synthase, partial [Modestobacter sp.]|nr:putative Dihydrodipicolinate synthase [Modestobacter sp.]